MKDNFWQKIKKRPILALAPMAGITDSPFRQICKQFGADIVYSEMASVSALNFTPKKTLELLKFKSKERPYIVQLFGNNPEHFKVATKMVTEKIKPDGIDINFGCPVRKVFKTGAGVALMLDLDRAYQVIKSVLDSTCLPVSIKVRTKIEKVTVFDLLEKIKKLEISAIMVHGRSYKQGFVGQTDLKAIKKVKKIFKGVTLGNGGIDSPQKAKEMIEKTDVDGIGIARGSLGRPWIFKEIKDFLSQGNCQEKNKEEIIKIALSHARLLSQTKKEQGIKEARKHLCWYVKNFPHASSCRKKLTQVKNYTEIKNILKNCPFGEQSRRIN